MKNFITFRISALPMHAALILFLFFLLPLTGARGVWARQTLRGHNETGGSICSITDKYDCYTNHRYGYVIAWPKKLLVARGESDAGDGQIFDAPDGRARLLCWAMFNDIENKSLLAMFREAQAESGLHVTYKHMGKNCFVVSGTVGNEIVYKRTIINDTINATFILTYDKSLRTTFDVMVEDIAKSFRANPEFQHR